MEHDIHPGTFYNWVRRLRQKPDLVIPEKNRLQTEPVTRQEVIKVELPTSDLPVSCQETDLENTGRISQAMELSFRGISLRIPNGTDPQLLGQLLVSLKEFTC